MFIFMIYDTFVATLESPTVTQRPRPTWWPGVARCAADCCSSQPSFEVQLFATQASLAPFALKLDWETHPPAPFVPGLHSQKATLP